MKPSLVRITYTTASLVAMVPAAVWAVVGSDTHSAAHALAIFPFYYLVWCQLLIIPRYVLAAWLIGWLHRRMSWVHIGGGVIGFTVVGVCFDAIAANVVAIHLAQPAYNGSVVMTLLVVFRYALPAMLLAAVVGGVVAGGLRGGRH